MCCYKWWAGILGMDGLVKSPDSSSDNRSFQLNSDAGRLIMDLCLNFPFRSKVEKSIKWPVQQQWDLQVWMRGSGNFIFCRIIPDIIMKMDARGRPLNEYKCVLLKGGPSSSHEAYKSQYYPFYCCLMAERCYLNDGHKETIYNGHKIISFMIINIYARHYRFSTVIRPLKILHYWHQMVTASYSFQVNWQPHKKTPNSTTQSSLGQF